MAGAGYYIYKKAGESGDHRGAPSGSVATGASGGRGPGKGMPVRGSGKGTASDHSDLPSAKLMPVGSLDSQQGQLHRGEEGGGSGVGGGGDSSADAGHSGAAAGAGGASSGTEASWLDTSDEAAKDVRAPSCCHAARRCLLSCACMHAAPSCCLRLCCVCLP
jgi:hypothetical protein